MLDLSNVRAGQVSGDDYRTGQENKSEGLVNRVYQIKGLGRPQLGGKWVYGPVAVKSNPRLYLLVRLSL